MFTNSAKEAQFAKDLGLLKMAQGKTALESWERQIRFPLIVDGITIGHLVVDFLVRYADGRRELVEVKSAATQTALYKFKNEILSGHIPTRSSGDLIPSRVT